MFELLAVFGCAGEALPVVPDASPRAVSASGYDPDDPADNDGDGFTEAEGDCADWTAGQSPAEREVCPNGLDEDCDGEVDEYCEQVISHFTTDFSVTNEGVFLLAHNHRQLYNQRGELVCDRWTEVDTVAPGPACEGCLWTFDIPYERRAANSSTECAWYYWEDETREEGFGGEMAYYSHWVDPRDGESFQPLLAHWVYDAWYPLVGYSLRDEEWIGGNLRAYTLGPVTTWYWESNYSAYYWYSGIGP